MPGKRHDYYAAYECASASSIVVGTAHEIAAAFAQQLAMTVCQAFIAIRTEQHRLFGMRLLTFYGFWSFIIRIYISSAHISDSGTTMVSPLGSRPVSCVRCCSRSVEYSHALCFSGQITQTKRTSELQQALGPHEQVTDDLARCINFDPP